MKALTLASEARQISDSYSEKIKGTKTLFETLSDFILQNASEGLYILTYGCERYLTEEEETEFTKAGHRVWQKRTPSAVSISIGWGGKQKSYLSDRDNFDKLNQKD